MTRQFFASGESLVLVKGNPNSGIGSLTQLGLPVQDIIITPSFNYQEVTVDAWGRVPVDVQWMNAIVSVSMTLSHIDMTVLQQCTRMSMGGAAAWGQVGRAGTFLGNNAARFANGNNFIGLNIASPVGLLPWCFYYSYLDGPPLSIPIGVGRSLIQLNWRVIPYVQDPWNSGLGSTNALLWGTTLDS